MLCEKNLEDWTSKTCCGVSELFRVHPRRTPKSMERTSLFSAQTTILDSQTIPSSNRRLLRRQESTELAAGLYALSPEPWTFTSSSKENWQITGDQSLRLLSSQATLRTWESSCPLLTNVI